ncbi:MAG: DUF4388 domain-containing protein [Candidatus Aminicenantes bacterium]|nr:DUF4388 domain-containing protein [Candidatus Aminicenantes bacterium]
MSSYFPVEGTLKEGEIFAVLYYMYKNNISGLLVVKTGAVEKKVVIEDNKIVFASSGSIEDSLGNYLIEKKVINRETYEGTNEYITENKIRFGRGLVELGFMNYDQLWMWVQKHLRWIIFSLLDIEYGEYRILINQEVEAENIVLDLDIAALIIEGMRGFRSREFLDRKFAEIENLYVHNSRMIHRLDLKPYEVHIYDLIKRESQVEKIVKSSELLEFDTLRILYFFLVLEILSTEKVKKKSEDDIQAAENSVSLSIFKSFEEALRFYNTKYELVYKVLSKEIGPISLSILSRAVEDIMENLPGYFQKVQLNPNGGINEELLKSVWYQDFDSHAGGFLRGLEEILYAEIYMVKKHLGVEQEQQVLKWLNKTGS